MEKLNELKEAFYPQYGTPGSRDMDVTARRKVIDENIEAVAEHIRALERTSDTNMAAAQAMRDDMYHWKKRAEAAEAALERESDIHIDTAASMPEWRLRAEAAEAKLAERDKQNPKLEYIRRLETELAQLRTRPAPAADLAALVPDELTTDGIITMHDCGVVEGFNACRAAILRNIEEEK